MFSKLALVATTAFAVLAVAAPTGGGGQCSTGEQHCCNSVQQSNSPQAAGLLGSLGVQLAGIVPVGLTCTPLSGLALSSQSCSQQPVCCNGNNFNGLVVIGCTPINVGA